MIKEGSFLKKYGIQLGLALGQQTDLSLSNPGMVLVYNLCSVNDVVA